MAKAKSAKKPIKNSDKELLDTLKAKRDSAVKYKEESGWCDRYKADWNYYLYGQSADLGSRTVVDKNKKRKANYVFSNIEGIIPKIFDKMPSFQVVPRGESDQEAAQKVEAVMRYEVDQIPLEDLFKDATRDELVSSIGILKVCWAYAEKKSENKEGDEVEEENPIITDDRPEVKVVNPQNFFITAGDHRLSNCAGVFEKMHVSPDEAKSTYGVDMVSTHSIMDLEDKDKEKHGKEMGRCEVWEFHGEIDGKKMVVAFNSEKILKTRDWYQHGRLPYVDMPCYQLPHEYYPYSEVFQIQPLQDELVEIDNQASEFRKRAINPKKLVMKGAVDAVNMERLKNPKINVVEVNDINGVKWENAPIIGQDIYNMRAAKKEDIGLMTGQNEISRGGTEKVVKTATGQQILFDAAQGRIRDKVRTMERAYREVLRQIQGLLAQFMDDARAVKITDEQGEVFDSYSKEDIQGDFDFIVDITEAAPLLRDKRAQLALQAYEQFKGDSDIDQVALKKKAIKMAFPDLNVEDLIVQQAPPAPEVPPVEPPMVPAPPPNSTMPLMGQTPMM